MIDIQSWREAVLKAQVCGGCDSSGRAIPGMQRPARGRRGPPRPSDFVPAMPSLARRVEFRIRRRSVSASPESSLLPKPARRASRAPFDRIRSPTDSSDEAIEKARIAPGLGLTACCREKIYVVAVAPERRGWRASPGCASAEPCSRCSAAAAAPSIGQLARPSPPSLRCAACRPPPSSTAVSRSGCAATPFTAMRMPLDRCRPSTLHRRRDVHQREVPHLPVAHLLEVELRPRPRRRNPDRRQQFARLQHRHARDVDAGPDEVVLGVHHALAAARCGSPSARRARSAPAPCPTDSPPRSGPRRESRARG